MPSPTEHDRLRGWGPLLVATAVFAGLIVVVVAVRTAGVSGAEEYAAVRARTTSDFRDFWWTARHFRESGEISSAFGVHNYLPFFTIFLLPWSFLPFPLAAVLFTVFSLGLTAVSVVLVEGLLKGGRGARPRAALLVSLGLMAPYIYSCAVLGNVGLLLAFLVVTTWFLVERGREWEAGLALGLATLIKLLPGLLLVFFLLKGRWRVAGSAAAVIVVLGLGLPLGTLGYKETVATHAGFYDRAVRGGSAYEAIMRDHPPKALYSNNSVPMVLRRLLSPVNAGPDDEQKLFVNLADLPRPTILGIYAVLTAVLVLVSIAVTLRGARRWPPDGPDELRRLRGHYGLWCCLVLLTAPLVWTHYLPLAYWPLALVADGVERARPAKSGADRLRVVALLVWLVGAVLLAWPAGRAAGAQIASVVFLWFTLTYSARAPSRP